MKAKEQQETQSQPNKMGLPSLDLYIIIGILVAFILTILGFLIDICIQIRKAARERTPVTSLFNSESEQADEDVEEGNDAGATTRKQQAQRLMNKDVVPAGSSEQEMKRIEQVRATKKTTSIKARTQALFQQVAE